MHVGMKVKHLEYGLGTVKSVSEHLADIRFDGGLRSLSPEQSPLEPADAQAEITALNMPLTTLIAETVSAMVKELNLEQDDAIVEELGARWQKGTLVLKPSDPNLQPKPIQFFWERFPDGKSPVPRAWLCRPALLEPHGESAPGKVGRCRPARPRKFLRISCIVYWHRP